MDQTMLPEPPKDGYVVVRRRYGPQGPTDVVVEYWDETNGEPHLQKRKKGGRAADSLIGVYVLPIEGRRHGEN